MVHDQGILFVVCTTGQIGLLNANGKDITIESKHPFDLKGLSLCALWADKAEVRLEGWEKEVRKYATTQTVSRALITHCALDYRGIDRVELKPGGVHLVINTIQCFYSDETVSRCLTSFRLIFCNARQGTRTRYP